MVRRRVPWLLAAVCLAATPVSVLAIEAGITFDVHQDINVPIAQCPNDFHVKGLVCSNNGTMPVLTMHIDDLFSPLFGGTFTSTIIPAGLADPCWYSFEAHWARPAGIPYCTVLHLGLLFDVDSENVVIDLEGWWTRNGVRIGQIIGNLRNGGYAPVIGFNVEDSSLLPSQFLRIGNGFVIQPPPIPPRPPLDLLVTQMDVIPFPPGPAPNLDDLSLGGAQQFWPWVSVANGMGLPISPVNPMYMAPDSFFDIFLEVVMPGQPAPITPFSVQPGGFLVSRSRVQFTNNNNLVEERWFWEIHGAQPGEACCMPNGTCQFVNPADCMQMGGIPKGTGTVCLGDGDGNGVDDACEQVQPIQGACCFGRLQDQCMVTTKDFCELEMRGVWHGPGTDCRDLNGNAIADVCEGCNTPPADLNGDNWVDGADYGLFAGCFNGTGNPINPGCECADLNSDNSVDGADYGLFAGCFNGTGNPSPCS